MAESGRGRCALVIGMGKTGSAAEAFLRAQGQPVLCVDDKSAARPVFQWDEVAYVLQSPGVPLSHELTQEAFARGLPVCSDVDVFRCFAPKACCIGVTGTNGKSTTTALIHHILQAKFPRAFLGGNIGVPVLALPLCADGVYVLELSSYQLEISHDLNLNAAVWTNISPDHLDRHGTMERYVAVKSSIFAGAAMAAVGEDDAFSKGVLDKVRATPTKVYGVSVEHEAEYELREQTVYFRQNPLVDIGVLPNLPGRHNAQNILCAFAVARHCGVESRVIAQRVRSFRGLAHRLETVAQWRGIEFVNDSKATNADSLIRALACFPGRPIYLIAGGRPKSDGIAPAVQYMQQVREVFLVGEAGDRFAEELGDAVPHKVLRRLDNALSAAIDAALEEGSAARPVLLLSPACASFDQYNSFEERGDVFRALVGALTAERSAEAALSSGLC